MKNRLDSILNILINEAELTQEKYDNTFNKTEKEMEKDANKKDPECEVSFGRFQKIINIWIKYHVALAYYETENSSFKKYKKLLQFAHIPVDRTVIKWFSSNKNVPDKATRDAIKKIRSWKWELTPETYYKIQQAAKDDCKRKNMKYPLELEMKVIWIKDKEKK